jgi:exopolysaccharide biosynthesis polyprenyl glycosylphosphotransferase
VLKQQHQLFVGLLAFADGLVIAAASFFAWFIRRCSIEAFPTTSWEHPPKEALVLFTVPIGLLALYGCGLYRPRRDRSLVSEILDLGKTTVVTMMALLAVLYVFRSSVFSPGYKPQYPIAIFGVVLDHGRLQLGTLAIVLPAMLVLERITFRSMLRWVRRRGWNLRHVAVIGCGRLGQIVARTLERNSWTGIRIAYFVSHQDHTRRTNCLNRPVLGGLDDLERVMDERKPDAVYVALPGSRANLLSDVLRRLDKFPVDVRVVPDISPRYVPQNMAVSDLDGMPILSYRENPASGLGGVSKRIIDILGSIAALVIFAPVMAAIAAVIRLAGPGPVIFRQKRVSLGGEVFEIYKFRTMYHVEDEQPDLAPACACGCSLAGERAERGPGAPADPVAGAPMRHVRCPECGKVTAVVSTAGWTERNDPRITSIGRWLRATSLDELPQLFNVLTGDMSLVGPRPERPELIARFREDWRGYMMRQHVKAGMTGWAQIHGLRGQTSLRKRLQYDLFYVRNWSLALDLRILAMTIVRGFVHRNAH